MNHYVPYFNKWAFACQNDLDLQDELASLTALAREADQAAAWQSALTDRFYKTLDFGTGGLRGVMGLGPNRMNRYVVRQASSALAAFLVSAWGAQALARGVVIACDSRAHSRLFAVEAARTLAAAGISAKLFGAVMPTPVLSFAVRHLGCVAGVVITASHNPRDYNGYKVYDHNGCQLTPAHTAEISRRMQGIEDIFKVPVLEEAEARARGLIADLDDAVLNAFIDAVLSQAHPLDQAKKDALGVVYSPLHGTGGVPVTAALSRLGFCAETVPEQAAPDGGFPTVSSPNPEDSDALALSIRLARQRAADLVLATDPDCDRVGAAVRHGGDYHPLTGNQIGALLVSYLLLRRQDALDPGAAIVKTIVTNDLGAEIARRRGLHVEETLTGFKYIGEQIGRWAQDGAHRFLAGYEESYGYLVGAHARDKDAVVASALLCEMTAYYKAEGKTLLDVLEALYDEYGFYLDALDSFSFAGMAGEARIAQIMSELRALGTGFMAGMTEMTDYLCGESGLPKADVLKFRFEDGSWIAVRPSGTEPKIKLYYAICQADNDKRQAYERLSGYRARIKSLLGP